MTVAEVAERVTAIGHHSWDDESAHCDEDALYRDVLEAIAQEAPTPWRDLAHEALRTQEYDFARWYA